MKLDIQLLLKNISKFIYPPFCRNCKVFLDGGSIFCSDCESKIKTISSLSIPVTAQKELKVFAISAYRDPLRSLILAKKYSDVLASKQLAQIMLERTIISHLPIDFIVPIPLHWSRYASRGYNQSFVMAKTIGKKLNIPVIRLLKRNKRTIFQSRLSFAKRQLNVKGAFDISFMYKNKDLSFLKDKNILLVDDLCTTSATLRNSSKIIFELKPKSINAVVACRVI